MGKFVNKNSHLNKRDGLEWHSCGVNLECSSIFVPLDHQDPNSELISLQLTKYPAKEQPAVKTVLVNPGGPGVEGTLWVEKDGRRLSLIFAGKVDIVGFDPRGTGNSSPNCPLPHIFSGYRAALEKFNAAHLPLNSNIKMIRYFDRAHQLGSDICASTAEKMLSFVSTPNTARDMDLIRRALGMDKLNYFGISYGTVLGLTYANMFPDTVGSMILDGIVNPKDYYGDIFTFIRSATLNTIPTLEAVTKQCDRDPNCPLYGAGRSSKDIIYKLLYDLGNEPKLIIDEIQPGILTAEMVESCIFRMLRSASNVKLIIEHIALANNGSHNKLYLLCLQQSPSRHDIKVTNPYVHMAISCADREDSSHYSLEQWKENMGLLNYLSFPARLFGSQLLTCWKRYDNQERYTGPWNNTFANPILMISNSYDPVCSLERADNTHELLKRNDGKQNSALLKLTAIGHTSFSQPSVCVIGHMKEYLLGGRLPPLGKICTPYNPHIFNREGSKLDEALQAAYELGNNMKDWW